MTQPKPTKEQEEALKDVLENECLTWESEKEPLTEKIVLAFYISTIGHAKNYSKKRRKVFCCSPNGYRICGIEGKTKSPSQTPRGLRSNQMFPPCVRG